MIEKVFPHLYGITSVEVSNNLVTIILRTGVRHTMTLPDDPDRDDHVFKLPVAIQTHRVTYEDAYLRFWWYDTRTAEFTLKAVTS